MATKNRQDMLLPSIIEIAWDKGFNICDFWRDEYREIREYPLTTILETCEFLAEHDIIDQLDDGTYVPSAQSRLRSSTRFSQSPPRTQET